MRLLIASAATLLLAASAKAESPAAAPAAPAKAQKAPVEVRSIGEPGMVAAGRTRRMTAVVKGVDSANRVLTLDVKGRTQNVKVGPAVKRFDEIAAGDTVTVEIDQGLLLEYQPTGSAIVEPKVTTDVVRAEPDKAPAGTAGRTVQATVAVTAIDLKSRLVTLQGPQGGVYQVKAGPKIAIEKLKVGDKLLATYSEAVAVALVKKQPKPTR